MVRSQTPPIRRHPAFHRTGRFFSVTSVAPPPCATSVLQLFFSPVPGLAGRAAQIALSNILPSTFNFPLLALSAEASARLRGSPATRLPRASRGRASAHTQQCPQPQSAQTLTANLPYTPAPHPPPLFWKNIILKRLAAGGRVRISFHGTYGRAPDPAFPLQLAAALRASRQTGHGARLTRPRVSRPSRERR